MNEFNRLVTEQMKTMDRLLFLQSELERFQKIEMELRAIRPEAELESVQLEITKMEKELKDIQRIFEIQTEEVIRSYQAVNVSV